MVWGPYYYKDNKSTHQLLVFTLSSPSSLPFPLLSSTSSQVEHVCDSGGEGEREGEGCRGESGRVTGEGGGGRTRRGQMDKAMSIRGEVAAGESGGSPTVTKCWPGLNKCCLQKIQRRLQQQSHLLDHAVCEEVHAGTPREPGVG